MVSKALGNLSLRTPRHYLDFQEPLTTSHISLMSSIMKLFNHVIEQRLHSYLEEIGLINKYQSGFK